IHSAAGLLGTGAALSARPPFRAPHHSASTVALIGGGSSRLRPGEASCAHRGVLFLDELAEFSSDVLDSLRQPLEEGHILVCRARASVVFPADFLLVAAMNPCPCGGDGSPGGCRCSDVARQRFAARVSGPLLDRFDLRLGLAKPDPSDLLGSPSNAPSGEPSSAVAERVMAVRRLSAGRGLECNARIPAQRLDELAPLEPAARSALETRLRQGRLSARGLHRVRRVARTLADLGGRSGPVAKEDVLQALALRSGDLFSGDRPR
ncbi:MAG: ATP-binding protein, partial [Acidimicrobiales bacterium]